MNKSRLATGLAGFVVAFVSVVVLKANGHQNAPSAALVAALDAGIAVATLVVAKGGSRPRRRGSLGSEAI